MFNRANKITSLLLAAAAVASFVPATGVNAATRLSTKEGTIDGAVAFDGKYIYEGYKSDDDDKAVWYNNGEKDSQVTDYDDEDYDFTTTTYGEKYILAQDGNDDYLVDLTSGKVLDETLDDKLDNTASALEKAIKKTDKFDGQEVDQTDLSEVASSAKFQAPWYSFDTTDADGDAVRIFTSADGKYVTADQLANIYAYSTAQGKVVKINKFDKENTDAKLSAHIVKAPEVIAQDKDYLYAIVNVDITDTNTTVSTEATKATAKIDFSNAKYANVPTANAATGDKEKYTITWATGSDVTFGGKTYTFADTDSTALYDALKSAYGNKYSVKVTATGVTVEAKTKEDVTADKITSTTSSVAVVNGVAATVSDQPAVFNVAGHSFTYGTGADYTDENSLRNAIITYFAVSTNVPTGYSFDASTLTFTSTATSVDEDAVKAVFDENVTVKAGEGATTGDKVTNAWYLQKISKAQGEKDDEAYMPKSVDSYLIDNKSLYDNGDMNDAYDWLINGDNIDNFVNVQVADGSLYAYKMTATDKVKVLKLDLKKVKEDSVAEINASSKLDGYAVKKDGDTDHDCDAISVDVNGTLWLLDDGKIVKFDKKDKTDVYSCDSGFDSLSVYDENNLIAWNEDDERYTTVTEGKKQTLDDAAAIDPNAGKPVEVKTGWQQDATGAWTLLGSDGAALTGWQNVGGAWYYMDPTTTIMATGWKEVNGTWYFLNNSGAMVTGWYFDGSNWYYLEPVNTNGSMKTGWFQDTTGTWYYADQNGHMLSNTVVDGYVLSTSGAWVK